MNTFSKSKDDHYLEGYIAGYHTAMEEIFHGPIDPMNEDNNNQLDLFSAMKGLSE